MQFENMAYAGGSGQRLRDQAIALSDTQSVNTTWVLKVNHNR